MASRAIVVGSWPGPSFGTNDFVRQYARALEEAGCRIVDVPNLMQLPEPIDILHIHWPEQLLWQGGPVVFQALRIARAMHLIRRLKRQGTKVVWMVHNLRPHEMSGTRRLLWLAIAHALPPLVDGVMTLSPATMPLVAVAFPTLRGKPSTTVRHPPFPVPFPPLLREGARVGLLLPPHAKVLAMLGFLRPYKGADRLLAAFRELAGPDHRLIVAGRCSPDHAAALGKIAGNDPRITLITTAIDDAELARYTAAADWIVLPFRSYLHSGSMIHALSFGRPVLTPSTPFAQDLAGLVTTGAVRLYENELDADTLRALPIDAPIPDLSALTLESIGQEASRFYKSLKTRR